MPDGIATSGFPAVRETCRRIGVEFDPWQTDLNRCVLARTADGLFAADTVGLSIARQVGKTFDIGAVVFALCIAHPGTTVVWTAHRFKVARETFNELRALAKGPLLVPHLDYDAITTAAGNQTIPFRNGSRIVFGARERGSIRGFTKVRILVLDEAQILTHAQLADLAPTMNQATDPLIILMGTPPKPSDPGEVFTELREGALAGTSQGLLWVELAAEPGSDPDDETAWRKANPSYPARTPARAILRLRKLLSPDDFMREALGVWDESSAASVIPLTVWADQRDASSSALDPVGVGLAVTSDRSRASVGVAGRRTDGALHLQVIEAASGTGWLVPYLSALQGAQRLSGVGVEPGRAAGALLADLTAAHVQVVPVNVRQHGQACGDLYDKVMGGRAWHRGDARLTAALTGARKRQVGDGSGLWVWEPKDEKCDVTPLQAVTNALHVLGAATPPVDRRVVVFR